MWPLSLSIDNQKSSINNESEITDHQSAI